MRRAAGCARQFFPGRLEKGVSAMRACTCRSLIAGLLVLGAIVSTGCKTWSPSSGFLAWGKKDKPPQSIAGRTQYPSSGATPQATSSVATAGRHPGHPTNSATTTNGYPSYTPRSTQAASGPYNVGQYKTSSGLTANATGARPYPRSNGTAPAGATNFSQGRAPASTGALNTADVRNSLYNKSSAAKNPYQVGRTSAQAPNPRSTFGSQPAATSSQYTNNRSTPSSAGANNSTNPYNSPTGYPTTGANSAFTPPTNNTHGRFQAPYQNQTPYTSQAPSATTAAPSNSGASTSGAGSTSGATSWPANGTAPYRPGSTNANLNTGAGTTPAAGSTTTGHGSVYR